MQMKKVVDLTKKIRDRIREHSKDYESLAALAKKNPELAKLCADIDSIIDEWAYQETQRIEAEMQQEREQGKGDRK